MPFEETTMGTMAIGGFQPFSLSDFPGRPAAIVFTQGCNFRCPFCHNVSLWPATAAAPGAAPETILSFLAGRRGLLGGVVVTGGEPTLQAGLADFLAAVRGLGLTVKLDTNGSRPDTVAGLLSGGLVDYVAMDVKAPFSKYNQLCGCAVDKMAIRRSMDLIAASGVPHHFRTTFYQTLLSETDIEAIQTLVPAGSEFKLQAYRATES
jgi:pyruvate formate lyase activating enzyme